ncbi:MAG TPA: ribonuclease H-like domain-containing protein [Natrialbaceae archaeon]|nr:ribonuclease H-like domain-containing protein [Natrialbaceae archaeon]
MRLENTFVGARGIGETTERDLWRQGVTHWDDFDRSVLGGKRGRRLEDFIEEARDRLADDDARFFDDALPNGERWRLYENFRENACFFDIETTGLDHDRDVVTTVSFHRDGETTTLVRGRDLTREAVRAQLDEASLLVTFNGKRFDVPFLETSFDLDVNTPHLDAMYTCRKLDLSGGLKPIEREIGLDRDRPDISGRDAVRLWHEYERGDESALETLVEYNREDTVNLRRLLDDVTGRLHDRVFERVRSD